MQDQTATSVDSVPQNSKLVTVTRKEGLIALTIAIIHLIVFPLSLLGIGQLVELNVSDLSLLIINFVWMLVVAAATVTFLRGFFKRSWTAFRTSHKDKLVLMIGVSYVIIFVGNIIVNLVIMPVLGLNTLDGDTVNLQLSLTNASPAIMLLMAGILAPVIEETLFRGAFFGYLHTKSRIFAWVISVISFALVHVWQMALFDATQWVTALGWIPMAIGFTFIYRRSGNVFAAIILHMFTNIVSILLQIILLQTLSII